VQTEQDADGKKNGERKGKNWWHRGRL